MDSQTFEVDKTKRQSTDAMFLQVNVARIFSVGKRITKKIKLVEASSEGESRIAEDLVFAPFWTWTLTYIPRWAGKFDSNAVIDRKPYLDYTVVGADEGVPPIQPRRSHKRHRRRFLRLPALGQLLYPLRNLFQLFSHGKNST